MRQLYWAAANHLDHFKQELATLDFHLSEDKETNLSLEAEGVRLEYIWDPWLNSTSFARELVPFKPHAGGTKRKDARKDAPALLAVGSPGLWATRHGGAEYMDLFRAGVDPLLPYLNGGLYPASAPWLAAQPHSFASIPNQLVVVPAPTPFYKRLTPSRKQTMTPEKFHAMNGYLRSLPGSAQSHIPWAFNQMTEGNEDAYNVNGIHVTKDVRERALNVLLNVRCNAGLHADVAGAKPLACRATARPNLVQVAILLIGIVATPIALIKARGETVTDNWVWMLVAPLSLAAVLSYLADRTHMFTGVNRVWDSTQFIWRFIGFIVLAFMTPTPRQQQRPSTKNPPALAREYSDEFKGILQALILLYSQYDGDSSLGAYKVFRLAIAGYIFLSAYGHATYFLTTNDYSLRRVATVLLRLNLMSCLLAFTLSTPWTTYYFAPLISFWFLTTFTIIASHKLSNEDLLSFFLKTAAGALFVNVAFLHLGLLETLLSLANIILGTSWDGGRMARELAFDSITPFIGVISAGVVHRAAQLRNREFSPPPSFHHAPPSDSFSAFLDDVIIAISGYGHYRFEDGKLAKKIFTVFTAAVLGLVGFILLSDVVIRYRDTYENCHLFLSWIPILCVLYLRSTQNGPYLALPAFLGKIPLELYLLHHHVWLIDSGTRLLAIWPRKVPSSLLSQALFSFQRVPITVAFIWIAAKCHEATRLAVNAILGVSDEGNDAEVLDADLLESKGAEVKLQRAQMGWRDVSRRLGLLLMVVWGAPRLWSLSVGFFF